VAVAGVREDGSLLGDRLQAGLEERPEAHEVVGPHLVD
jgi:hypothetical protein